MNITISINKINESFIEIIMCVAPPGIEPGFKV